MVQNLNVFVGLVGLDENLFQRGLVVVVSCHPQGTTSIKEAADHQGVSWSGDGFDEHGEYISCEQEILWIRIYFRTFGLVCVFLFCNEEKMHSNPSSFIPLQTN